MEDGAGPEQGAVGRASIGTVEVKPIPLDPTAVDREVVSGDLQPVCCVSFSFDFGCLGSIGRAAPHSALRT